MNPHDPFNVLDVPFVLILITHFKDNYYFPFAVYPLIYKTSGTM